MASVIGDVNHFLVSAGQTVLSNNKEQADLYRKLIEEEYGELQQAFADSDDTEIADAIFDLCWVAIGYGMSRGWNMGELWKEGSKSNLAKIDPVTGKVRRREDGKILKPEGWQPPNFKKFVE